MRRTGTLLCWSLALGLSLAACSSRSVGTREDGGLLPDGSSSDASVIADHYGYIVVAHLREGTDTQEFITLNAAFFEEQWDPVFQGDIWDVGRFHLLGAWEALETPDGIPCEALDYEGGPDPPERPVELDAGEVRAWPGSHGDEPLAITFNGEQYVSDFRNLYPAGTEPWPTWLADRALTLQVETGGSPTLGPVRTEVALAQLPELSSPVTQFDDPIQPDANGILRFSWTAGESQRTVFSLQLLMGCCDRHVRCHLPAGQRELRLPHGWLQQYTGPFELTVTAVNDHHLFTGGTAVTLRTHRARRWWIYVAE